MFAVESDVIVITLGIEFTMVGETDLVESDLHCLFTILVNRSLGVDRVLSVDMIVDHSCLRFGPEPHLLRVFRRITVIHSGEYDILAERLKAVGFLLEIIGSVIRKGEDLNAFVTALYEIYERDKIAIA